MPRLFPCFLQSSRFAISRPLFAISKPLSTIPRQPRTHLPSPFVLPTRAMSSTTPSIPAINVSSNSNPATINAALPPLLERWTLTSSNSGLQRSFKFKTFKKTWAFMDAVAAEAARVKHHPEWSNVYNTTLIRWTTHHPAGLSEADVQMASFCDTCAAEHGELPAEKPTAAVGTDVPAGSGNPLEALADGVVVAGGECCVPKYARKGAERVEGVVGEELHEKGP